MKELPQSCDTFVVFGDKTAHGDVIFGKNSDRPNGEVQEIVHVPASDHPAGSKLSCTYIEIEQSPHTHAVILSKPSWMWGAEMGANEHGVVVGNEAIWTKLTQSEDKDKERLLGMDLVRLGLERAATARQAVDVIADLLAKHGQGGPCSDTESMTYSNSFLIADAVEAWVLEAAGRHPDSADDSAPDAEVWVAKKFTGGFKNISNCLSIRADYDLKSANLEDAARKCGWDGSTPLDFKAVFQVGGGDADVEGSREKCGRQLLEKLTSDGKFGVRGMMRVLRDAESEISRGTSHKHPTAGSQISMISKDPSKTPCVHWFTGTPDPTLSFFKPFVFVDGVTQCADTLSPTFEDDPAKKKGSRFQGTVDRGHRLYKLHEKLLTAGLGGGSGDSDTLASLREMEVKCIEEMEEALANFNPETAAADFVCLFNDCVEAEIKFYE